MVRPILIIAIFLASANPLSARTWNVNSSGTGDAPTIAAAMDSSVAGDRIELECGTYFESRLNMKSGVTICSNTGNPDCVTIDGSSPPSPPGSVISCYSGDNDTLIEGLTITGGHATDSIWGIHGGGLKIGHGAGPRIERCVITGNYAKSGGGVSIFDSQPTFVDCEISGNESLWPPGGVQVTGGGVFTAVRTSVFSNIGFPNHDGSVAQDSEAYFYCCDITLPLWRFQGSYYIDDTDCDQVSTEAHSWGSVKALFR